MLHDSGCVGKSMADASIWIALVSMLSVFHITKAKDASGNDIEVPERFGDGIVSQPLPFECSITPRSEAAKELIINNPPIKLDSNPMFYD
ncbi:hypothetical protein DXG03_005745 [Asterophora parasitica]|uniref:Uncharacterized protein n=1 Tax=Asterophora parasitica TaxID=117018 RepID=A0A9P7GEA5_9AGAR|nr:hypothetical protein DXG03_005745 [Asterophora parasitica]